MKYKLFKHPKIDLIVAVKVGFSWPALFFNFFWMLIKGFWIYAGSYLMVAIILANLEKIVDKTNSPIFDAFMLISYVAMLIVPGFMGNKWREEQLEERGYKIVNSAQAVSPEKAIKQAAKEFIVVLTTLNQSEMIAANLSLSQREFLSNFPAGN